MKGVDEEGVEVDARRADGPDGGGVLRDLDVATLRAFLIGLMRDGGVSVADRCEVMRVSKSTLFRDAQGPEGEPGA